MPQIIIDIFTAIRNQIVSAIAAFILGTLALWLKFSQDKIRNEVMSFLTSPQHFSDVLFIFAIIAFLPFLLELYRSFSRTAAIKYGAILIFENHDVLTIQGLTRKWWEAAAKIDFFDYNHNYERIRRDYVVTGKLKLDEPIKTLNASDPLPEMLIKKTEFIRWMRADRNLLIPPTWCKR